ncbi:hypothetical protein HMPREF9442_01531 [Paraprevotella xylaniphila YIT 11841]|uniref:Uncharacterized protein n=1 Tax=Paraprevotella xylaniphila YIT 11841 TaxID=762982 RepID=F3QTL3_9BACT|nr:hypothetical protein HMPREF9442_01531 [Paraprevotella xylaniphila YIT 11841]
MDRNCARKGDAFTCAVCFAGWQFRDCFVVGAFHLAGTAWT